MVFDTLGTSRKARNLRANPAIALVIGGLLPGEERTVQYEGIADEPSGAELERLKQMYYAVYPDGPSRLSWPDLIYVRVRPRWIRYSDYTQATPLIVEFSEISWASIDHLAVTRASAGLLVLAAGIAGGSGAQRAVAAAGEPQGAYASLAGRRLWYVDTGGSGPPSCCSTPPVAAAYVGTSVAGVAGRRLPGHRLRPRRMGTLGAR